MNDENKISVAVVRAVVGKSYDPEKGQEIEKVMFTIGKVIGTTGSNIDVSLSPDNMIEPRMQWIRGVPLDPEAVAQCFDKIADNIRSKFC